MSIHNHILNITLSAVVDTEIVFPYNVDSVMIQNRDGQDMQLRMNPTDAAYFTIHAGSAVQFDVSKIVDDRVGWLRAVSGTGPAEIIGKRVD